VSRKGRTGEGTGGGGWVHTKGANSVDVAGLGFEKPLIGWSQVGHFLFYKHITGLRNCPLT